MRIQSHAKRPALRRTAPLMQSLEARQLFTAIFDVAPGGAVIYTGSSVDNNFHVAGFISYGFGETAEPIVLTQRAIDAGAVLYPEENVVAMSKDEVSSILVNTAGGNDTVNVNSTMDPTTINTSVGSGDLIIVGRGPSGGSANAIDGDLTLMDTGGAASVLVEDFTSPPKIVTLNDNVFTGLAINGHTVTLGAGITKLDWYVAYKSTTTINITQASSLETLNIFGGIFDSKLSEDSVNVWATPASLTTSIQTFGHPDYITIGNGTTANVLGTVNLSDTSNASLFINDQNSGVARNVVIDNGVITGAAPATINYGEGVTSLGIDLSSGADTFSFKQDAGDLKSVLLTGGAGGDTFKITPSSVASVLVVGGDPVTPTATPDTLVLDLTGVTDPSVFFSTGDTGEWNFSNRRTVTFIGIDGYDATNIREIVKALDLSDGLETSLLAKLNLKGDDADAGRLAAFISHVDTLLKSGQISIAEAEALTQAANLLLLAAQH